MSSNLRILDSAGKEIATKALLSTADLQTNPIKLGRAPDNDVVIPHSSVSRYHCKIEKRGSQLWIVDLESVNGLRFNGLKHPELLLNSQQEIKLGELTLIYEAEIEESPSSRTGVVSQSGGVGQNSEATAPGFPLPPEEEKTVTFQVKSSQTPGRGFISEEKTVVRSASNPSTAANAGPSSAKSTKSLPMVRRPRLDLEQTQSGVHPSVAMGHQSLSQSASLGGLTGLPEPEVQSPRPSLQEILAPLAGQIQAHFHRVAQGFKVLPWRWVLGVFSLSLISWWLWNKSQTVENNLITQSGFWSYEYRGRGRPLNGSLLRSGTQSETLAQPSDEISDLVQKTLQGQDQD